MSHESRRPVLRALLAVMAAAVLTRDARPAAQPAALTDRLLRQQMQFSSADLRALDAGAAIVSSLDTPVRQEIAHLGVVYVNAPAAQFIDRFRDIERFERGPGVPQIGRFGRPPALEDLAELTLPPEDVDAVKACQPADCDLKLPSAAMSRFRTQVNWSSPDAARQANGILRDMILDLVRAYATSGNAALGEYDDGGEPLPVAEQFRALLTSVDFLPAPVPALVGYLNDYPRGRPAGAEDIFYWSIVNFGLKPTIRVNHVVIYPLPAGSSSTVSHAIAIKQLYASHYFHTTLEWRFLLNDDRPGRRGFYLLSITRARTDGTTGLKGLLLRPIINRRSRDAVRGYLEHVKRQVERPAPAT